MGALDPVRAVGHEKVDMFFGYFNTGKKVCQRNNLYKKFFSTYLFYYPKHPGTL
jgi:hypothetical protein